MSGLDRLSAGPCVPACLSGWSTWALRTVAADMQLAGGVGWARHNISVVWYSKDKAGLGIADPVVGMLQGQ
jgi:hypothetical protein